MSRVRMRWIAASVWIVPAALTTMQMYLLESPEAGGGSLWGAASRELPPWTVWAIATPFILRAAARRDLVRRIPQHIAAMLAIAVAFGTAVGVCGYLVRGPAAPSLARQIEVAIGDWLPIQPLVYAGVIAVGIGIDSARRRREDELARVRLEGELARARLEALRAQLQPHFLFNTLNAAVALARAGDTQGCAHVLVLLGELLHQLLRDEAPQEVSLAEELALVERYLDIQRVRFGDRLVVDFAIDDTVRDALVPQLLLQPLVENAFRHGLSRKTQSGKLAIAAARVGDQLELSVRDDGPGPAPAFELGVGLRNTGERLQRLYGARGSVSLTGDRDGAIASVTLPLRSRALEEMPCAS